VQRRGCGASQKLRGREFLLGPRRRSRLMFTSMVMVMVMVVVVVVMVTVAVSVIDQLDLGTCEESPIVIRA
jgi:hypothetical protein